MGRFVLLTATLLGASGCSLGEETPGTEPVGHEAIACQACHQGGEVGDRVAAVPSSTCSSADCHGSDNPQRVMVGSVEFDHRGHGSTGDLALGCAGCHTHSDGIEELWTEEEPCALCHREEMSGASGADCKSCHAGDSQGFTSQGVEVPHEGQSWIAGACVRCHYDVSEAEREVSSVRCSACHEEAEAVTTRGLGLDLHPQHAGVPCTSCHDQEAHRILAMSSAVELVCSDCHSVSHGLELALDPLPASTCNGCHASEHEAQQRLLLGLLDQDIRAAGSEKFMDGLTCRSCHVETRDALQPIEGSRAACVGCHGAEYGAVLDWWHEGLTRRSSLVEEYLRVARRTLGAPSDSIAGLLLVADDLLATLRTASGVHNLPLAHRMLEGALGASAAAYLAAGATAPEPPNLGREPSMGLCSYCHYERTETMVSQSMDNVFHREVMGVGR